MAGDGGEEESDESVQGENEEDSQNQENQEKEEDNLAGDKDEGEEDNDQNTAASDGAPGLSGEVRDEPGREGRRPMGTVRPRKQTGTRQLSRLLIMPERWGNF